MREKKGGDRRSDPCPVLWSMDEYGGEQPTSPLTRMGICSRCGAELFSAIQMATDDLTYINSSATRCQSISSCRFDSSRQAGRFVVVADSIKKHITVVTASCAPLGATEPVICFSLLLPLILQVCDTDRQNAVRSVRPAHGAQWTQIHSAHRPLHQQ